MDERERRVEIQLPRDFIHDFGGKRSRQKSPLPPRPPLSVASPISTRRVAYLELRGGRRGGHKSRRYWCGYEPQSNGDDSARSFFFAQRWASGHSSFNVPLSSHPCSDLHSAY